MRETNKTCCSPKDKLKAKIIAALTDLNDETIEKSCRRFRSHLDAVVEADGDLVE